MPIDCRLNGHIRSRATAATYVPDCQNVFALILRRLWNRPIAVTTVQPEKPGDVPERDELAHTSKLKLRIVEHRPDRSTMRPMTAASLQHVRALLSGIFAHAVADGRVDVNPIRDAKCRVNAKPSRKVEHYTAAEMRGILTALANHPQAQAIMALAFIGMRPAEIIGLRWEDVVASAIHVERSMWRGQLSDGGKSKRSRRVIPTGPFINSLLARYQGLAPSISGFVFENSIGKPLNTSGLAKLVRDTVRPTIEKFGYTWRTMYAGRHGAITETNRHTGGDTQVASHLFGHTPEVEAKIYLHGVPDDARRAALALDSALSAHNERQLRDSSS